MYVKHICVCCTAYFWRDSVAICRKVAAACERSEQDQQPQKRMPRIAAQHPPKMIACTYRALGVGVDGGEFCTLGVDYGLTSLHDTTQIINGATIIQRV